MSAPTEYFAYEWLRSKELPPRPAPASPPAGKPLQRDGNCG
jgi:hypothetical protein